MSAREPLPPDTSAEPRASAVEAATGEAPAAAAERQGTPPHGDRFGRWFEEFEVGQTFRHWPGRTITAAENHVFCLLTMAASPVHIDAHYAAQHMEGGRNLVVGTFVYATLLGMSVPDTSGRAIAALGTERLRHRAPLHHGDTLYGESAVTATRPSRSRPSAGIVTVRTSGTNQDGVVVCEFERSFIVPRQEAL